jgi:hypothetical protein
VEKQSFKNNGIQIINAHCLQWIFHFFYE